MWVQNKIHQRCPHIFYHLPLGVLGLGHGEKLPGHRFYPSGCHPPQCSHLHLAAAASSSFPEAHSNDTEKFSAVLL